MFWYQRRKWNTEPFLFQDKTDIEFLIAVVDEQIFVHCIGKSGDGMGQ